MRCSKCGRSLGMIAKFCPKCGTEVTAGQKKKSLITFVVWLAVFLILIPVFYYLSVKSGSLEDHSNLEIFGAVALVAFLTACVLYLIYLIIYSIVRFFIIHPIVSSVVLGAVLILVGFGAYAYLADKNEKDFSDSLYLIQDNLAEATVAKIMGDSLVAKKPLITASWQRVGIETQMVSGRLKALNVPKELESYKEAAIAWTDEVGIASLDPKVWKDVADDPGNFDLKLRDKRAEQLFEKSVQKISEFKEFGDNSIKMKNNVSMLYIGAKLRVERHWLNGITHSEKASLLGFNFISSAEAALPAVPEVGPGMDVTCQVCGNPSVKMTDYQRKMYNCDLKCNPSGQQGQSQGGGTVGGQTTGGTVGGTNSGQTGGTTGGTAGGMTGGTAGSGDYQTPTRRICIGRGGTSTGSGGPTNVYCVEDVLQSTNGIDASAIGFAKGEKNSGKDWENGWHNLEGLGVISTGEPSAQGNSPTVQKFYDECTARGGTVGGAGMAKVRLPTTEFGYTCDYKKDSSTGCWAFLTYSGGAYMGGNPGCEEKNLLPDTGKEEADKKVGGRWDGHYVGPLSGTCASTSGRTYADTVGMDFAVVNNVTYDSTVNVYVSIDEGGFAIETFQTSVAVTNGTAYVSGIFYFGFNQNGFSGSGSMDATGVFEDGTVDYASCTLTGSGTKQ
ncbi:MAG: zinc-ribbon domain-containing protein [Patescibacteria group bacterium]